MKFYEITYTIEDDMDKRLSALAERYKKVNDWDTRDMLQFAVAATSGTDIMAKLQFLEEQIAQLEKECERRQKMGKSYDSN